MLRSEPLNSLDRAVIAADIIGMRLPVPPPPDEVLADLEPLIPIVYEAMEIGTSVATHFFRSLEKQDRRRGRKGLGGKPDVDLYPSLVRFFAKREFDRLRLDVEFEREQLRNNGLLLRIAGARTYNVRILKNDEGELPAPGKSVTKKSFYQQSFAFMSDGNASSLNLVILWYLNRRYWLDHLSLVCPKNGSDNSAESYWQKPIPHPAHTARTDVPMDAPEEIEITPKRLPKVGTEEKE